MKNSLFKLIMIGTMLLPGLAIAQDDAPERPSDVGVGEFDEFKNTSFNILEESAKLKDDLGNVDAEIKQYSGMINEVQIDKLKKNYESLTGINKSVASLNENIGVLDNKSKALLESAKSVSPKMKAPKATSNTNKSIQGLDAAKSNLNSVSTLLEEDSKLLKEELKKRGELIE